MQAIIPNSCAMFTNKICDEFGIWLVNFNGT